MREKPLASDRAAQENRGAIIENELTSRERRQKMI
jgi:hypothetical protein